MMYQRLLLILSCVTITAHATKISPLNSPRWRAATQSPTAVPALNSENFPSLRDSSLTAKVPSEKISRIRRGDSVKFY